MGIYRDQSSGINIDERGRITFGSGVDPLIKQLAKSDKNFARAYDNMSERERKKFLQGLKEKEGATLRSVTDPRGSGDLRVKMGIAAPEQITEMALYAPEQLGFSGSQAQEFKELGYEGLPAWMANYASTKGLDFGGQTAAELYHKAITKDPTSVEKGKFETILGQMGWQEKDGKMYYSGGIPVSKSGAHESESGTTTTYSTLADPNRQWGLGEQSELAARWMERVTQPNQGMWSSILGPATSILKGLGLASMPLGVVMGAGAAPEFFSGFMGSFAPAAGAAGAAEAGGIGASGLLNAELSMPEIFGGSLYETLDASLPAITTQGMEAAMLGIPESVIAGTAGLGSGLGTNLTGNLATDFAANYSALPSAPTSPVPTFDTGDAPWTSTDPLSAEVSMPQEFGGELYDPLEATLPDVTTQSMENAMLGLPSDYVPGFGGTLTGDLAIDFPAYYNQAPTLPIDPSVAWTASSPDEMGFATAGEDITGGGAFGAEWSGATAGGLGGLGLGANQLLNMLPLNQLLGLIAASGGMSELSDSGVLSPEDVFKINLARKRGLSMSEDGLGLDDVLSRLQMARVSERLGGPVSAISPFGVSNIYDDVYRRLLMGSAVPPTIGPSILAGATPGKGRGLGADLEE